MRYHYYLEYLFENEGPYRRVFLFTRMAFLISLVLIFATFSKKVEYKITGEVLSVEKGKVQRKNSRGGNFYLEDVVLVEVKETTYVVISNFRERWDDVLRKVHPGDTVSITCYAVEEVNREFWVRHLEKKSEIILNSADLDKTQFRFKIVFFLMAITSLAYSLLLYFGRKNYLSSKQKPK